MLVRGGNFAANIYAYLKKNIYVKISRRFFVANIKKKSCSC